MASAEAESRKDTAAEPKKELSTDAGAASRNEEENETVKQETHTGSVFDTSKTYDDKAKTYDADLTPEEEDD
eukprot:817027-Karenia_brevis.AAC.1